MAGNGLRLNARFVPVLKLPLKHTGYTQLYISRIDDLRDHHTGFIVQFLVYGDSLPINRFDRYKAGIQFGIADLQCVALSEGGNSRANQRPLIRYGNGNRPERTLLKVVVGVSADQQFKRLKPGFQQRRIYSVRCHKLPQFGNGHNHSGTALLSRKFRRRIFCGDLYHLIAVVFPEPLHHTAVRDLRLAIGELDAARTNAAERGIALDLDFIAGNGLFLCCHSLHPFCLRDLDVSENAGMCRVLQDGSRHHLDFAVLHGTGRVEVRQILPDSAVAGQRSRVEAVVHVKLDSVDVGQAGNGGIGSADVAADTGLHAVIAGDSGIRNGVVLAKIHKADAIHGSHLSAESFLGFRLVAKQPCHGLNLGDHGAVHQQSVCLGVLDEQLNLLIQLVGVGLQVGHGADIDGRASAGVVFGGSACQHLVQTVKLGGMGGSVAVHQRVVEQADCGQHLFTNLIRHVVPRTFRLLQHTVDLELTAEDFQVSGFLFHGCLICGVLYIQRTESRHRGKLLLNVGIGQGAAALRGNAVVERQQLKDLRFAQKDIHDLLRNLVGHTDFHFCKGHSHS
nr:MAG TPA: hypothetical protein [Caudoviricetes sp.]